MFSSLYSSMENDRQYNTPKLPVRGPNVLFDLPDIDVLEGIFAPTLPLDYLPKTLSSDTKPRFELAFEWSLTY
jgi:hypothetical protein